MLIGFVGGPCSGKTTVAAKLFSDLKTWGYVAEYIPEVARKVIAEQKMIQKVTESSDLVLTDSIQMDIIREQEYLEEIMMKSVSDETYIITDSNIINSIGYLNDKFYNKNKKKLSNILKIALERYNLLFYCHPVPFPESDDLNRVHTPEQIDQIDKDIINRFHELTNNNQNLHESLYGSIEERSELILNKLFANANHRISY